MRLPFRILCACLCAVAAARGETLHGRVIDRASLAVSSAGKGVAGAKLIVYDSAGRKVAAKATGKSGAYAFARLAPGTYAVSIARKEYQPSPLLRVIALGSEDTLSRDFAIDRLPAKGGIPIRAQGNATVTGKRKAKPVAPYYPQLAEGMLASLRIPGFHREAARGPLTLARFHDPADTTLAYRALWASLLWAEAESQDRPVLSLVYLAHAYDSALRIEGIPAPAALKPWLRADPDSAEALASAARAMMLSPTRKDKPATLAKKSVPKSITLEILEAGFRAAAPKPKKKAFLAKIRGLIGPEAARRFASLIDPPKKRPAQKPETPAGPPAADMARIWKAVSEAAAAREPNPVALFHVALRKAEAGKAREAIADLDRLAGLRPDDPKAVDLLAGLRMAQGDTAAAAGLYDSLSRADSPEWQARGFRAAARIHWRAGRGEAAERALWRALGLESAGPAARADVLLLANVSLARDSWRPVEPLLDSLVKARPREAEAWHALGRMALIGKQDGVALDRFRKAAALSPRRPEFASSLAAAHFAREECPEALRALQPARASLDAEGLGILGQCLLRSGRSREAVDEFARLHAAKPDPVNLAAYARALTAARRAQEAVEAIQGSPHAGTFGARKALAEAHLAQGAPGRARQALETQVPAHGEDAELRFLLGKSAFGLREYPEASRLFTAALRYREDYPEAKYLQGISLLKQGRSGEARHYFLELADMEKASWRAKGLLGQGQAFAREEKPEAAEENLRKSFQAAPSAEAAAHLALALLKQGKPAEAAEWAARARKLDPDEPLALMASVDALLAEKREDEAVALAQSGLDAHPEGCDFLVVAAKARLRAGQDAEAAELSRKASGLCPEESAPYYYLGTLSARAGTVKEARRLFAEYLRTGGDAKRVPVAYR